MNSLLSQNVKITNLKRAFLPFFGSKSSQNHQNFLARAFGARSRYVSLFGGRRAWKEGIFAYVRLAKFHEHYTIYVASANWRSPGWWWSLTNTTQYSFRALNIIVQRHFGNAHVSPERTNFPLRRKRGVQFLFLVLRSLSNTSSYKWMT